MTAGAIYRDERRALTEMVRAWDRRLRLQRALRWLPFSVAAGLGAGIVLVLALGTAWISAALALTAAAPLLMLLIVWVMPRADLESARDFDLRFELQERMSTAFELIDGRIHADEQITLQQIRDAYAHGQIIDARAQMPLQSRFRDWLPALALAVLLAALLLFNPLAAALPTAPTVPGSAAVAEAGEALERITQEIAADAALSPEERAELLQQLQQTREALAMPEITPEEALATLSSMQAELQERAQELEARAEMGRNAQARAAESLRAVEAGGQMTDPSAAPPPQAGGEGMELAAALQQISEGMESMDQAQREQLADALEQAADALEATNPEAAQALRDAAEALRQGDTEAAQEALERAAEALDNQQQRQQNQQQAAENLRQQAQQLGQPGQPGEPGESGEQGEPGGGGLGEAGAEGVEQIQEGGGQPGGEAGDQPGGDQPGEGGQPGGQPGDSGTDGGAEGGQPGAAQSEQPGGMGAGAGDQPGGAGSDSGGGQPGTLTDVDNSPDGTGESQYQPIYAPRRIGGEGGDEQIVLEPDQGALPLREGQLSENPTGDVLVPYNEVFSDYSDAVSRELARDYIPLGLRDIVRDYFASLEPGR